MEKDVEKSGEEVRTGLDGVATLIANFIVMAGDSMVMFEGEPPEELKHLLPPDMWGGTVITLGTTRAGGKLAMEMFIGCLADSGRRQISIESYDELKKYVAMIIKQVLEGRMRLVSAVASPTDDIWG